MSTHLCVSCHEEIHSYDAVRHGYAGASHEPNHCISLLQIKLQKITALVHPLRRSVDQQVAEFHKIMSIPDRDTPGLVDPDTLRLRMRLVIEECFELVEACLDRAGADDARSYKERVLALVSREVLDPDLSEIADALGDIDYVVAGTRLQLGIQGQAVANAIHKANMAKAPGGVVTRDVHGKVQKPEGWTPPDITAVLRKQGLKT